MTAKISRRHAIGAMGAGLIAPVAARAADNGTLDGALWFSTQSDAPWQSRKVPALAPANPANFFGIDATVNLAKPRQTMRGFGACFNELGWVALSALAPADRHAAMATLFARDQAAFSLCRTPVGANDFARGWYSYDETAGDFDLKRFSIANDHETLIPFIKEAQSFRPDLQLWASPWSPPSWMKKNGFYAMAKPWPGGKDTGIRDDQTGHEGEDHFIQEDRYFDAYARYFGRYVQEYAKLGITIGTVMPQNEFNSAQPYASCCWTPEGLARFLPFLGREMDKVGTKVFFGTLERGNPALLEKVMADPKAAAVIKGVGVQWDGKRALPEIARHMPDLEIWGTEWECGTASNDWHYARYGWTNLHRYITFGASAWDYWNAALPTGGLSGWGWPQNSLIVVDPKAKTWRLTPDYWLMRHVSSYVQVGARAIPVDSFLGFDDHLAFRNPDGSLVLVANNAQGQAQRVRFGVAGKVLEVDLPADSLNTLVLPASALA
jgi:glucosylceramidase